MPRERVTPTGLPGIMVGGPRDGLPDDSPRPVVDIRWTRGCYGVGVNSTLAEGSGRVVVGMVNQWLATAKMPTIDVDKLFAADPGFGWDDSGGFNAQLDTREDVNRLITVLRHARDGAFGKDA